MMNSRVLGITVCEIKHTFSNIYGESTFFPLSFSSQGAELSKAHVFHVVFGNQSC